MKNRFIVIYTVFAAAVFIFSVSFFGYNLFNEYQTNLEKSETKYTALVNEIRTISFNQDENTPEYSQAIKKAIGDPAAYSYIHVRRNNETVILYPSGKSREETVSRLTTSKTDSLTVNKQSVTVDCNIYLIRPDSIFYYARISFLMILIITIITIIMIIYLNLSENTSDVISMEEMDETEDNSDLEIEDNSEESDSENDEIEEDETEETVETEQPAPESEPVAEESAPSEPETETEVEPEEEKHAEVTPEEVQAILAEPFTEPAALPVDEIKPAPLTEEQLNNGTDEPSGLYNPETGISWESYLSTRLNNEIDRATASEIDLSLFVIKLFDIGKSSEEFKNVCNYLSLQFQFKDLLFEYKEDCIVAIKISMNVDEALALADKLYGDICNIINSNGCRIGISSRSIRMVTGDRLILEADQAIEHSDADSPVIAFRVDSEKYRQLMEQNQ